MFKWMLAIAAAVLFIAATSYPELKNVLLGTGGIFLTAAMFFAQVDAFEAREQGRKDGGGIIDNWNSLRIRMDSLDTRFIIIRRVYECADGAHILAAPIRDDYTPRSEAYRWYDVPITNYPCGIETGVMAIILQDGVCNLHHANNVTDCLFVDCTCNLHI